MGRRSKFSLQQKLIIINEAKTTSTRKVAKKFSVDAHTIRRWQRIFNIKGSMGLKVSTITENIRSNSNDKWL